MNDNFIDALHNKLSWLLPIYGERLHHVPGIDADVWAEWWEEDAEPGYIKPTVITSCNRVIDATLPGLFTRMGTARCYFCCDKLGIPQGCGAALNDDNLDELRKQYPWAYSIKPQEVESEDFWD